MPCDRSVIGIWTLVLAMCSSGPTFAEEPEPSRVRGIILFVVDGMGVATITAARAHRGWIDGVQPPPAATLRVDAAPRMALLRTWSEDALVTESAAAITAMLTGEKVPNGVICVRSDAGGIVSLPTLLEIAEANGLSTGVVSTARITHATPAGAYAHVPDRGWEEVIAAQMLPGPGSPGLGNGIEVILGGGRDYFVAASSDGGRRKDGIFSRSSRRLGTP